MSHTAPKQRLVSRRLPLVAVGVVVLLLSAFSAWAAYTTVDSTTRAGRDSRLSDAYQRAQAAVVDIRLSKAQYIVTPGSTKLRGAIASSETALANALRTIASSGDPADRALAEPLERELGALRTSIGRLMNAADSGNISAVSTIDPTGTSPLITHLETVIDRGAASHRTAVFAGLDSAKRSQAVVLLATALMFVLGVLLMAALSMLVRYKQRLEDAQDAELDRLRGAALTDSLTGLPNHRAFHEGLDRSLSVGEQVSLVMVDLDGLKRTNDELGHQAGDELIKALAQGLERTLCDGQAAYRIGGDEFAVVLRGGRAMDGFYLAQGLRNSLASAPGSRSVSATAGIADLHSGAGKDLLIWRADLALIEAKRAHRGVLVYSPDLEMERDAGQEDDRRHVTTLATALARAVDAKDAYTHSHCETVAELCALVAEEFGLPPERVARIRLAGLLHDVGKIGVSDAILQKPGPLTAEEFAIMQTHPTLGCHIVSAAELEEEARWIRHHHERLDGAGYPDGLLGSQVPIESRIIMVADAFEAITADRPYRDRRSVPEALRELSRHAGTQFDPRCLEALERIVGDGLVRTAPRDLDADDPRLPAAA